MGRFSKMLDAQHIPEWKDAFVNYWQLKTHVKKIKLSTISNHGLSQEKNMINSVRSFYRRRLSYNATDDQSAQILHVYIYNYTYI